MFYEELVKTNAKFAIENLSIIWYGLNTIQTHLLDDNKWLVFAFDTHLIHSWYTFETQLIHIWNTLKYKTATLWYGIDLLLHKHTKIGGKVGQTFESMLHGCGKIQHKVHIYGKVLGNSVLHLHIVLPSYKQTIRWNFQHSV